MPHRGSRFGLACLRGSRLEPVTCWRGSWLTGGVLLGCPLRPHAQCVSSGVRGSCAPVESSAGIGFAACAGKHYRYFVIGTKAAFLAYPC